MLDDPGWMLSRGDRPEPGANPFRPSGATSRPLLRSEVQQRLRDALSVPTPTTNVIIGPRSSGRSTMLIHVLAEASRRHFWYSALDINGLQGSHQLFVNLDGWLAGPPTMPDSDLLVIKGTRSVPSTAWMTPAPLSVQTQRLLHAFHFAASQGAQALVLGFDGADAEVIHLPPFLAAAGRAAAAVGLPLHVFLTGTASGLGGRLDSLAPVHERFLLTPPTFGELAQMLQVTAFAGGRPLVPAVRDYAAGTAEPVGFPAAQMIGSVLFDTADRMGLSVIDQTVLRRSAPVIDAWVRRVHRVSAQGPAPPAAIPTVAPTESEGLTALARFLQQCFGSDDDPPWRVLAAHWCPETGRAREALLSDGRRWRAPARFGYPDHQAAEFVAGRGLPGRPPTSRDPRELIATGWQALREGNLVDAAVSFDEATTVGLPPVVATGLVLLGLVHHLQGRAADAAREWEIARCLHAPSARLLARYRETPRDQTWRALRGDDATIADLPTPPPAPGIGDVGI